MLGIIRLHGLRLSEFGQHLRLKDLRMGSSQEPRLSQTVLGTATGDTFPKSY